MRALARSDASAAKVEALGAEAVRGDLGDRASLAAGAAGCATRLPPRRPPRRVGADGRTSSAATSRAPATRSAGCAEAGVRRFVHCGTEAALMAGEPLVHVDETAPLRPDSPAPYPATKAKAELAVREASREGFETVVVAPPLRLGQGRHDAAAGDGGDGRGGQMGLGRRRPQRHRHRPRRQRRRGPAPGRREGQAAERPTSSPTASPSSFATSSPRCSRPRASSPPTAACPAWTAAPLARICEAAWKAPAAGRRTADDPLPLLDPDPGMHDRDRQGP